MHLANQYFKIKFYAKILGLNFTYTHLDCCLHLLYPGGFLIVYQLLCMQVDHRENHISQIIRKVLLSIVNQDSQVVNTKKKPFEVL